MALILQQSRFLHTPKTGGTWVNHALTRAGMIRACLGGEREHLDLTHCPDPGLFTLAFVRHPWTWWRSYWVFKQHHGWDAKNPFDADCQADEFETFLRRVLDRRPGHCTRVFTSYTGPPDQEIAFVGRYERLVDDLVLGLSRAGEPFNECALRATPPVNVGDYRAHHPVCSPELRALVLAAEAPALSRFGYDPSACP